MQHPIFSSPSVLQPTHTYLILLTSLMHSHAHLTHPPTYAGRGGFLCHWTAIDEAGTNYTSGSPDTLRNSYSVPISPCEFANCTCRGGDTCPRTAVYLDAITFTPALL
jgi:hypothetical protein